MAVQYRHFNQSEVKIDNGGVKKFKRYIGDEQKKFLQLIDGTITEIKASDFEPGITILPSKTFYFLDSLSYLELPDTITTIEKESIQFCQGLQEIVFPQNLSIIYENAIKDSGEKVNIGNFSKAKKVPSFNKGDTDFNPCAYFNKIKVPANLLSSWISAWDSINYYKNIVSA